MDALEAHRVLQQWRRELTEELRQAIIGCHEPGTVIRGIPAAERRALLEDRLAALDKASDALMLMA